MGDVVPGEPWMGRPSDEELCLAARGGDDVAFLELYRRHQALAWRLARAATMHDEAAVAAVADGMVACVASEQLWGAPFRTRLAWAIRHAALARSRRGRRGYVAPEAELDLRSDDLIDLVEEDLPEELAALSESDVCLRLVSSSTTPPPELWALVQVAWQDFGGRMA